MEMRSEAPRLVVNMRSAICQYSVNPNTNYEVRLPATNFNGGQPLNTFAPTTSFNDATANGTSRDSNGIVISGNQVIAPLTTGDIGQNNHTYDFGFKSCGNELFNRQPRLVRHKRQRHY